jgi:LPXTG-motif cell wall-anchored protein
MLLSLQRIITNLGFCMLTIGLLFSAFAPSMALAADVELIGNDKGLELSMETDRLFNLTNLNPGDTHEANITIKNRHVRPYELFMRAERVGVAPGEEEADLFKQLMLAVYIGEREVYSGSMAGFAATNISLGKFDLNETEKLRAVVHLPGSETGNEFQGKSVDVKWIFTAQADELEPEEPDEPKDPDKPFPPKTGDVIPMGFYGLGLGLLGLGIGIAWKRKK